MFRKEIKEMGTNIAYWAVLFLPLILTFIMSQGTESYLDQAACLTKATVASNKEIFIYTGPLLNSKIQFAVSELSFMLMMCSNLIGLSVFEERRIHAWDRIVNKHKFILVKFLVHLFYGVGIIALSVVGYRVLFKVMLPFSVVLVFLAIVIVSLVFGLFVGLCSKSRALLSNTILMIVMLSGYFGGALSLTSVLANTKYMSILRYASPLTFANELIYKTLLQMDTYYDFYLGAVLVCAGVSLAIFGIRKRIKNGAII